MPVVMSPDSAEAQELAKWESRPTRNCPEPQRPYQYHPYPAAFYYAERSESAVKPVFEMHEVHTDDEAANMRSRGWGSGQAEAVQMLEARESAVAVAAAERAYSDRNMSEKAQKEAASVDESTITHLGEIPETPIRRKPGRPAKVKE